MGNSANKALLQAAADGDYERAKVAISSKNGADPNCIGASAACFGGFTQDFRGKTPIQVASEGGFDSIIEVIAKAGGDTNALTSTNSMRAIMLAARGGFPSSVSSLIECGANPNFKDANGRTALHYAAVHNRVEAAVALLISGANVNSVDTSMKTPLHEAHSIGMAQCLLEFGAEVNAQDSSGRTALHEWCNVEGIAGLAIQNHLDSQTSGPSRLGRGKWNSFGVGRSLRSRNSRSALYLENSRSTDTVTVCAMRREGGVSLSLALVVFGADLNVKDYCNQSPIDLCSEPLRELLQQRAAVCAADGATGDLCTFLYNPILVNKMKLNTMISRYSYSERKSLTQSVKLDDYRIDIYKYTGKERRRGWLYKLGAERRVWKQRYFKIDDGRLSWYQSPKSTNAKNVVILSAACVVHELPSRGPVSTGYSYSFKLKVPGFRAMLFYASTSKQRMSWVISLRSVIKRSKNKLRESFEQRASLTRAALRRSRHAVNISHLKTSFEEDEKNEEFSDDDSNTENDIKTGSSSHRSHHHHHPTLSTLNENIANKTEDREILEARRCASATVAKKIRNKSISSPKNRRKSNRRKKRPSITAAAEQRAMSQDVSSLSSFSLTPNNLKNLSATTIEMSDNTDSSDGEIDDSYSSESDSETTIDSEIDTPTCLNSNRFDPVTGRTLVPYEMIKNFIPHGAELATGINLLRLEKGDVVWGIPDGQDLLTVYFGDLKGLVPSQYAQPMEFGNL